MQLIEHRAIRNSVSRVIGGDPKCMPSSPPPEAQPAGDAATARHSEIEQHLEAAKRERQQGYEAGRKEGFNAGREDGFKQGVEQGQQEGLAAAQDTLKAQSEALEQALQALSDPLPTLKRYLSQVIAEGAFGLAKRIVGEVMSGSPQALSSVVEDILGEASEARANDHALRLYVHPDDAATIEPMAQAHGAELVRDNALGRGDVKATLSRRNGDPVHRIEWDASLSTRLDEVRKAIGL